MDTLRGSFSVQNSSEDNDLDYDRNDDEIVRELPPVAIGTDERRMQVRAYNFWASLLVDRNLPSIEDLDTDNLPDFGPNSVLLDFSCGIEIDIGFGAIEPADFPDAVAAHTDVAIETRRPAAVDDRCVANQ